MTSLLQQLPPERTLRYRNVKEISLSHEFASVSLIAPKPELKKDDRNFRPEHAMWLLRMGQEYFQKKARRLSIFVDIPLPFGLVQPIKMEVID